MKSIKNLCDNYENCLKNKKFHPFCYKIGPSEDKIYKLQGTIKFQRSGLCWAILTGKVYWMEVKEDG